MDRTKVLGRSLRPDAWIAILTIVIQPPCDDERLRANPLGHLRQRHAVGSLCLQSGN